MKALIATLGFDEKFCYRAIIRHGISEGDKIVLLTANVVDRVQKAYEWVKSFIATYGSIDIELIEINARDFTAGVMDVIKVLESLNDYKLIVNLSGGMRILSLIVYAALTLQKFDAEVEVELEDFSDIVAIPKFLFSAPSLIAGLSDEKVNVLKTIIEEGKIEAKKLADRLNKDVTTIRRHLYDLASAGLIEILRRKPLKVRASDFARMVIR